MTLDLFLDINNEVLIDCNNYYSSLEDQLKIYSIFNFVKNEITYENLRNINKASETLVFRKGNNLSKNLLFYSLLKINNINCSLKCFFVQDNTKSIVDRHFKVIPWTYVKIKHLNKEINLDCSFDKDLIRCLNLIYRGNKLDYLPTDYFNCDNTVFHVISGNYDLEDLNLLNYYNSRFDNSIRGYCYV